MVAVHVMSWSANESRPRWWSANGSPRLWLLCARRQHREWKWSVWPRVPIMFGRRDIGHGVTIVIPGCPGGGKCGLISKPNMFKATGKKNGTAGFITRDTGNKTPEP